MSEISGSKRGLRRGVGEGSKRGGVRVVREGVD